MGAMRASHTVWMEVRECAFEEPSERRLKLYRISGCSADLDTMKNCRCYELEVEAARRESDRIWAALHCIDDRPIDAP